MIVLSIPPTPIAGGGAPPSSPPGSTPLLIGGAYGIGIPIYTSTYIHALCYIAIYIAHGPIQWKYAMPRLHSN